MRALPGVGTPRRRPPWEREAADFAGAVAKARLWLDDAYQGQVDLVTPTAQDETRRAWVFSCNTKRFLQSGQWQDVLLDATLVVPKDDSAPFGLPNSTRGTGSPVGTPVRPSGRRIWSPRLLPATPRGSGRPSRNWAGGFCRCPTTRTGHPRWRRCRHCRPVPVRWYGSAARTAAAGRPWALW
ncbi:YrhB domain-containing protein [Streptomyces sp. NPDC004065]|uniref:YrhB domain-containing protein n=1 Tax=Streptomyces sp. NPDC004065 TaxID=3364689 RepID=UPI00385173AF